MRRPLTLMAAALTAAVLAACGGGGGSSHGASSPAAAVKTYLTSVGQGNGSGACGVLSSDLQKRALSLARSQGIKASSCANLFDQVKVHLTPAQVHTFQTASVSSVTRTGNRATVTIRGASGQPTLVESGGRWLITGGIGF